MRTAFKPVLIIGTALLLAVTGTLAYASWNVPISGVSLQGQTATMPQGPTPTANMQGSDALVSWNAQSVAPGVKMQKYIVTAHDTDATHLPNVVHTVSASDADLQTSVFTAAELAGGKWKWAITPKFATWTGAESPLSNPKLVFPAAAPAIVLAAAVTAVAATGTTPPTAPVTAPVDPTPTPATVTTTTTTAAPEATTEAPMADPATSAPEPTPEKTESPKADPSPSGSPLAPDPSPSTSAP